MEILVMVDQIVKCSGQPKIRGSDEILVQPQTKPLEPDSELSSELQYTSTYGQSHV